MAGDGGKGAKGVSGGAPSTIFEILGESEEERLLAEAAPFRQRAMPQPLGRPRGSPNKRTTQMRDVYLRMGLPHPLIFQGQLLRMGIDGVAKEFQCDLLEAAELLSKVADRIAPYLESKMPTAVQLSDDRTPVIVVRELDDRAALAQARRDGALAIDDDMADALDADEGKQGLSAGGGAASHGQASHDVGQVPDDAGGSEPQSGD